MSSGRFFQQKPFDHDLTERLRPDDRINIQVEPAADTDPPLDRVKPSLPPLDARLVAQSVFHENEPAAGLQNAKNFADRRWCVGNAA
jgi:hypothetical protein